VNDNVRQGTAVQTGVQSRSELIFKDKTITRSGEKTTFRVGEGPRTIDLGSGQFLLYMPKHSGGAKVKAGAVMAAIEKLETGDFRITAICGGQIDTEKSAA
jgi:hypothetical protein